MYERVDGQRICSTAFGGNAGHCFRCWDAVGKLTKNLPPGADIRGLSLISHHKLLREVL